MVSIVIPMYNGEDTIERTVKSCLNQSYKDFEIIIVDDLSSDGSVEIVNELCTQSEKIKLYRNQENVGLCANNNKGIAHASGEYLLMLGQDDILTENHIAKMLEAFSDDVSMVYCNCSLIDENDIVYQHPQWYGKEVSVENLMRNNVISSCGAILKKKCVDMVGGFPQFHEYPNYGEWYLWINLASVGRIKPCDTVKALYRRHRNNISNTFNDKDKLLKLNRYSNKCRMLAIKKANICFIKRAYAYCYITLKNLQAFLRYMFYKDKANDKI